MAQQSRTTLLREMERRRNAKRQEEAKRADAKAWKAEVREHTALCARREVEARATEKAAARAEEVQAEARAYAEARAADEALLERRVHAANVIGEYAVRRMTVARARREHEVEVAARKAAFEAEQLEARGVQIP